jgi:hypothetical protein
MILNAYARFIKFRITHPPVHIRNHKYCLSGKMLWTRNIYSQAFPPALPSESAFSR